MVTFCDEEKTCSCCGKTSTQQEIMSYTTFGGPDLDLRPPPMKRDTMIAWIQSCPHCGYCSSDISDQHGKTREHIVRSSEYKAQVASNGYPELANKFLCYSIILEHEKSLVEALWQVLRAAWVCDDAKNVEGAKCHRLHVIKLMDESRAVNLEFSKQVGLDRCVEIDALRRIGEFQRARELIQQSPEGCDDVVKGILKFQLHLVESRDTGCYTIMDARKHSESHKE